VSRIVPLFTCFRFATILCTGATYYVAPSGSSVNSGLSSNLPWTFPYALSHAGASNTIVLMDGTYSDSSGYKITAPGQAIRAMNKWKAVLANSAGHGALSTADYVTIDGVSVTNAAVDGIKIAGNHCVVQNCWVVYSGQQGISSHSPYNSSLFQNNLVESNGWSTAFIPSHLHGFYIGGKNSIIRNNVSRYNSGFGIHLYPEDNCLLYNVHVYNNLVYNNNTGYPDYNGGGIVVYTDTAMNALMTNYFYGNTVIEPYALDGCINGKFGIMWITNNILAGPLPIKSWGGNVYAADYNLTTVSASTSGPHDVVTNYVGFVNTNAGLYWLKADSPARGMACSRVFGPVDFFGGTQPGVKDIGALQYIAAYAPDTYKPYPSAVCRDYWAVPNSVLSPTNMPIKSTAYK
jgi:hypothetical protein